jgi:hypothetical protein
MRSEKHTFDFTLFQSAAEQPKKRSKTYLTLIKSYFSQDSVLARELKITMSAVALLQADGML